MRTLASIALAASVLAAAPASAVTLVLNEDFSGYGPDTKLNALDSTFGGNWFTTDGTVDYLASGSAFGSLCPVGTNCVDLDGSTNNAGVFSTMVFGPGVYNILFQLNGNGRNQTLDDLTISFGGITRTIAMGMNSIVDQLTFGTDFMGIVVGAGGASLSFSANSNDNEGPILKTVVIEKLDVAPVPVPAAGGLLLAALGLLGMTRRRKA